MQKMRQEDLQMKIPALLHLSRLGYGYLCRDALQARDRLTNILPEALWAAAERINHIKLCPKEQARLMEDLQARLASKDLGRYFYQTLRNGWEGLRLIDFDRVENNLFQCAAELTCGSGSGSFRPDITLFVNGLPLAMIEMKTGNRPRGLRSEYRRMLERFHSESARRYLQCAQIWAFSDDHGDDPYRLAPLEGTFFATVMTGDFPVYAARERRLRAGARFPGGTPETESIIFTDNGLPGRPRTRAFQQSLSQNKPTHRMLTLLFQPERFLFLLRYGIQYIRETEPDGQAFLTRRMLTVAQLSCLEALRKKARRGYRNWTAPSAGAAGEDAANASMIALLYDLEPGRRLYWICADEAELQKTRASLEACGVSCEREEAGPTGEHLRLLLANEDPDVWTQVPPERDFTGRRVFLLPPPVPQYGKKQNASLCLRRRFPDAILVTRTALRTQEGSAQGGAKPVAFSSDRSASAQPLRDAGFILAYRCPCGW